MPYPCLEIAKHLKPTEVHERYRSCHNVLERERWHVISLMIDDTDVCSTAEAAKIVRKTPRSVRNIVNRYNKKGPDGLQDKRKGNSGRKPILTKKQQRKLFKSIQKDPIDGGLWTGPKVAQWVATHAKVSVSNVTGWQYLRLLGFTIQVPRPAHSESATPVERTVWKKNA